MQHEYKAIGGIKYNRSDSLEKKYKEQIDRYQAELKQHTTVFNTIGNVKLLFLILLALLGVYIFSQGMEPPLMMIAVAIFIGLVFLWVYHIQLGDKISYCKAIIEINKKYIARIDGNWKQFEDIGKEFIDPMHPYASDLDIVGEKSLFQLLNVTNTYHGRESFAHDLLVSDYDKKEILLRQEAISELSENIAFSHDFQYHSSKVGIDKNNLKLMDIVKDIEPFIKSKVLKKILTFLPLFTAPFVCGVFIFKLKNFQEFALGLLLLQFIVWLIGGLRLYHYFAFVGNLKYKLDEYSKLFQMIQNQHFKSKKLNDMKGKLSAKDLSASKALLELDKIVQRIHVRYNFLIYVLLNTFLLWDYECAFMLEGWKEKYAVLSQGWFPSLGEFESLLSFSNLQNINDKVCFPTIPDENLRIKAEQIGHPLLDNHTRIYNDFLDHNEIFIISGSNMSGKTTFLRTVGINLILSQTGCVVCANEMSCSIFTVISSMRITDSLSDGISTFYSELTKIKRIIDAAKINQNLFFLIDEIFRGTNSIDRLSGADTVITKLHSLQVMGIITTHDLELCGLDKLDRIKNLSFSEYYKDNMIHFDYKIKKGMSTTTNAQFLMEMIGIFE